MAVRKFRFYVTDTFDGCIKGTDDESVAKDYAQSEDFFVLDTQTGKWLSVEGSVEIKEAKAGED